MGKSLKEYAAEIAIDDFEQQETPAAKSYNEMRIDRERAEQLKQSVLTQLEQGKDPQIILYTALECIGLYSSDPGYIAAGQEYLSRVYADLAQLSFIRDNEAIAAERLEEMQAAYNKKLRNSINRQLYGYRRIERALNDALGVLNEMEQETD